MSIWTQAFIINMVVFMSWVWADRDLFNDKMERYLFHGKTVLLTYPMGAWVLGTVASIPAWLIYLVVTA